MKTNNANQAANYIIDAIYAGRSAQSTGNEIAAHEGSFAKMKSSEKNRLIATYVYLLANNQHEGNPSFNPTKKLPEISKQFISLLEKKWTDKDFDVADPAQAAQLRDIAQLAKTYKSLRAAIDVKLDKSSPGAPTKNELMINTAIESILEHLPSVPAFANQEELDLAYEYVAPYIRATDPMDVSSLEDFKNIIFYWQKLKASESAIAGGAYKLPNWPTLPPVASDRIELLKQETERLLQVISAQHENVIRLEQEAQQRAQDERLPEDLEPLEEAPVVPSAPEPSPPPAPVIEEEEFDHLEPLPVAVEEDPLVFSGEGDTQLLSVPEPELEGHTSQISVLSDDVAQ